MACGLLEAATGPTAHENIGAADSVAAAVEANLRRTKPTLPTLYLLDSIVKNIGGVYVHHFGRNLAEVRGGGGPFSFC